jgi:hypothetical protein
MYKKSWDTDNNNALIFAFEFNENNYFYEYFGIIRMNDKIDIGIIITQYDKKLGKITRDENPLMA